MDEEREDGLLKVEFEDIRGKKGKSTNGENDGELQRLQP
jgi:hypothetical protein